MLNDYSLYEHLSNLLKQLYPESYDEHQNTMRSLASMLAQKTQNKIKKFLDPRLSLPDAVQIWFPLWFPKTRFGIQFSGSNSVGLYVQQSLEPNGDFNSQIRYAEFRLPSSLSMTCLFLGLGGYIIYSIEGALQNERQSILLDQEKTNKILQEQGGTSLLQTSVSE